MQHTDFYQAFALIAETMSNELKAALDAHGGQYDFKNDRPPLLGPCIRENLETEDSFCVSFIKNVPGGFLVKGAWESDPAGTETQVDQKKLTPELMHWIIEMIPETKDVKNVTFVTAPDPKILMFLSRTSFIPFLTMGIDAEECFSLIRKKALDLTKKYPNRNWKDDGFYQTISAETNRFYLEVANKQTK